MLVKRSGLAIGAVLLSWGMMMAFPAFAAEAADAADTAAAPTEETKRLCKYQGEVYDPEDLVCWHDGYWRKCDGKNGRWINMRQKCKLI